jgi:6-phosphogluconolactonase
MKSPRLQVASIDALAEHFTELFAAVADRAIERRGRCTIAIAGGSVAERFLPRLSHVAEDWSVVHVFWCDERAVPVADPSSNAGAAIRLLLGTPAAGAVLHPMPADSGEPDVAAARYEAELQAAVGSEGRLDVVLLGVGEDGHVASLFPGHVALSVTERSVVFVEDAPKPPPRRMTLTLPVLARAGLVVVAAFGAGKAGAMRDALEGEGRSPVARVLADAEEAVVLLDDGAASLLRTHGGSAAAS